MKSRNYASAFYVLAFILLITPAFASATTDSANPTISSILPQTGREGDTITLKGKNFSSPNPDLEVRRYVNFNGFLETEIVDWQPSAIKVKVPPISAPQQERQKTAIDVVSKLPFFGRFGKYLFEFMPVQVAKAPTEEGVPVPVSVVVPSGESNVVDFTYINETSDKKTNPIADDAKLLLSIAWKNEVVDPITHLFHPIKSFTETTQRLGRVIAYSSVQTAHAPSTESTADIATPEKVVSPSDNAAVDKKSTTAVTKTSTQTSKAEVPNAGTKNTIPGKVTAYVTDQYGNAYGGENFAPNVVDIPITDALGERAGWVTVKDGRLESQTALPVGKYTMQVGDSLYSHTPVVKTFAMPVEGVDLGTLILNKWGAVKVKVVNEVGTTLRDARKLLIKCEITDEFIKAEDDNRYPKNAPSRCTWLANNGIGSDVYNYMGETDYALLRYYPAGNYTIQYSASGYETVGKSFSVNNRDVDLGTIVLKKK